MLLQLDFDSDIPIYQQIRNQIVMGIAAGQLVPGERLPATRALAEDLGVNTMTVSKAYQQLRQEGYVASDRRTGVVVRQREGEAPPVPRETIDGLRLRLCELRLAGLDRAEIPRLCEKLCDEEVR